MDKAKGVKKVGK